MDLCFEKAVLDLTRIDRRKQSYIRRHNRDPRKRRSPLLRLRLKHGMTQKDLAREAGLNPVTIVQIESGKPCRVSSLKKLGEFFDVPWHELVVDLDQLA